MARFIYNIVLSMLKSQLKRSIEQALYIPPWKANVLINCREQLVVTAVETEGSNLLLSWTFFEVDSYFTGMKGAWRGTSSWPSIRAIVSSLFLAFHLKVICSGILYICKYSAKQYHWILCMVEGCISLSHFPRCLCKHVSCETYGTLDMDWNSWLTPLMNCRKRTYTALS